MFIQDYRSTKTWNEELVYQKPRLTVQNYLWALQVFCDWAKKNPDELILERLTEISDKSDYLRTGTFKRILDFQTLDRSKTKHTRDMVVKALASFYINNLAGIDNTNLEGTRLALKQLGKSP